MTAAYALRCKGAQTQFSLCYVCDNLWSVVFFLLCITMYQKYIAAAASLHVIHLTYNRLQLALAELQGFKNESLKYSEILGETSETSNIGGLLCEVTVLLGEVTVPL